MEFISSSINTEKENNELSIEFTLKFMSIQQKITQRIKWKWNDIRYALGIGKRLTTNTNKQVILVYHGIDEIGSTAYNTRFISEVMFEKQINFFAQNTQVLSLDDFYSARFSQDKMNICLTFDDGYQNNLTRAIPILEKYKVPATIFTTAIQSLKHKILWPDIIDLTVPFLPKEVYILNTHFHKKRKNKLVVKETDENIKQFLQKKSQSEIELALSQLNTIHPFPLRAYHPDYYQTLTDSEIKLLGQNPLITIGAHGVFHLDLTILSEEECLNELQKSKDYLENLIQKKVNAIAFPFGTYNKNVLKAAEKVGYTQLLALNKIDNISHPHMRERFGVNPFISFENQILAIIEGKY